MYVRLIYCCIGFNKFVFHFQEASEILELAYNEYASAPQRLSIMEEFYGPTFTLFKVLQKKVISFISCWVFICVFIMFWLNLYQ